MSITRNVAEVLAEHVTLEMECIDRMYLNLYVPMLQTEGGVAYFWREHRGLTYPVYASPQLRRSRYIMSTSNFYRVVKPTGFYGD